MTGNEELLISLPEHQEGDLLLVTVKPSDTVGRFNKFLCRLLGHKIGGRRYWGFTVPSGWQTLSHCGRCGLSRFTRNIGEQRPVLTEDMNPNTSIPYL